jgi:hypothetical protein
MSTDQDAWKLYKGTYVVPANQPITRIEFVAVSSAGGQAAAGNFLDNVSVTGACACTPSTTSQEATDVLGLGMGDDKRHKALGRVTLPNWGDIVSLYGQGAHEATGLVKYVRFMYPTGRFVEVKDPISTAHTTWAVTWYGAELEPAANIRLRWFLQTTGNKNHVPRAFVLYPTYETTDDRFNYFETMENSATNHVFWEWIPKQTFKIELPVPLPFAHNISVEMALVDNDNDARPLVVTARTEGGESIVTQTQSPVAPNRGNLLNILTFNLQNVPVGTTAIYVDLESPMTTGDSGALTGLTLNMTCKPANN